MVSSVALAQRANYFVRERARIAAHLKGLHIVLQFRFWLRFRLFAHLTSQGIEQVVQLPVHQRQLTTNMLQGRNDTICTTYDFTHWQNSPST
jgi:hypothetical protein